MRKKLSAFLLAGILFFAGGTEGVLAAQAGSGSEKIIQDTVSDEGDISPNAGGLKPFIHVKVDKPENKEVYRKSEGGKSKRSKEYSSVYDVYSTNFYYNQLNSNERVLWDQLDNMCLGYLAGTESLTDRETYNQNGLSFNYYTTKYVEFTNMSVNEAWQVVDLFRYSNPQYYFLQLLSPAYVGNNSGMVALTVFDAFGNGSSRAAATRNMFSEVNSWMSQINSQSSEVLKEKMAHDLICKNVKYDPGYEDTNIKQNEYNQSAYSVFIEKVTVCAGYSQAMQLLMNGAGIDCGVVTSDDHEWNIIKLNNTWYYVDCTWDDMDGNQGYDVMYQYFNRSKSQFLKDTHFIHHVTENFWNKYLPNLDIHDSGATFSDYGTINGTIGQLAAPMITVSGRQVSITAQPGANIYYTLNKEDPRDSFTRSIRYTKPFQMTAEGTVRAVATASGYFDSPVAEVVVAKDNFKPQVMPQPVMGNEFILNGPEGDFDSSNYLYRNAVLLVMGNSECYNTLSAISRLQSEIPGLYQSGTEVLISIMDAQEEEDLEELRRLYPSMHFTYGDYGLLWDNLEEVGLLDEIYFPAIFLYDSTGRIVYYSTDYVEDISLLAELARSLGTGNPIPAPEKDQDEEEEPMKVRKLTITAISKQIAAGKKVNLKTEVFPKNADNKKVTWKTNNKKYATVNAKGIVTTKKAGAGKTVTITAKSTDGSGVSSSIKLKLMKHGVTGIKIKDAPKKLAAGKSATLRAVVKTNGKSANKKLNWKSSNEKYATISQKGKLKVKKAGIGKSVKITALSTDGTNKKATVKILIKKK